MTDTNQTDDAYVFFANNGPHTEDGNRYEGVVEGNALTFEGPARFQYQLDQGGKIDVNDDGAITTKWWLRNNSGEWKEWMTNINKKVS